MGDKGKDRPKDTHVGESEKYDNMTRNQEARDRVSFRN